jgi:hypothetical protein
MARSMHYRVTGSKASLKGLANAHPLGAGRSGRQGSHSFIRSVLIAERAEGAASEELWVLRRTGDHSLSRRSLSPYREPSTAVRRKVMSKETVKRRRALSILFLIGSVFLVAAVWNLPEPEM